MGPGKVMVEEVSEVRYDLCVLEEVSEVRYDLCVFILFFVCFCWLDAVLSPFDGIV